MIGEYQYTGCKEVEDVLSLVHQIVIDFKAGKPLAQEVLSQLGAAVGVFNELADLPNDISANLPTVLASASVKISQIIVSLLSKPVVVS